MNRRAAPKANLLLLPDFVGHPICYQRVWAALEARFDLRVANYHVHQPYEDIASLAAAVRDALGNWQPDAIVGYSFGGLVGLELAGVWQIPGPLVMIDTHRLADPGPANEAWLASRLDLIVSPQLAELVAALVELGEIDETCIRRNLALFTAHLPRARARAIHLLRCEGSRFGEPFETSWEDFADEYATTPLPTDHAGALSHPDALHLLLNLLDTKGIA